MTLAFFFNLIKALDFGVWNLMTAKLFLWLDMNEWSHVWYNIHPRLTIDTPTHCIDLQVKGLHSSDKKLN